MVKISDNYDLIWIFFQNDFKRFKAWELISLWYDCYFKKSEDTNGIIYKLISDENNNLNKILTKVFRLSSNINIKTIIWNNWAWKTTLLEIINRFYWNWIRRNEIWKFHLGDSTRIEINWLLYNISEFSSQDNITIAVWENQDILYIVKRKDINLDQQAFSTPLYLSHINLLKKQSYYDMIIDDEKFDYLSSKILLWTLKLAKYKNKIERIIKIKTYQVNYKTFESQILIVIKFFIINSIIINYYTSWSTNKVNVNTEVLEFCYNLYSYYYWEEKTKILLNSYITGLNAIKDSIKNDKNFNIYCLNLHFFYQYIIFDNNYIYKVFFNIFQGNADSKYHDDFFWKLKNYINDSFFYKYHTNIYDIIYQHIDTIKFSIDEIIYLNYLTEEKLFKLKDYIASFYKNKSNKQESIFDLFIRKIEKRDYIEIFDRFFHEIKLEIKKGYSLNTYNSWYIDYSYTKFFNIYEQDFWNLEVLKIDESYNIFNLDIRIRKPNWDFYYISDFSSWEKQLIWIINWINNYIKWKNIKDKVLNIIIDEPEISLHLEWQRKFMYYLIQWVNTILNRKNIWLVNIYIATHSPFIISDLPKENIIFLYKDNEEDKTYIKTFDEIKKESNLIIDNTFMANIPELIRWPFFLDDVYGELWKEFINNININDYDKAQELVWDKFLLKYLLLNKLKND